MKKNHTSADDYSISSKKETVDGEELFSAHCPQFPDVVMYAETRNDAVNLVAESINSIIEMSLEMNHPLPHPESYFQNDYSGRITLRIGKALHREIALNASRNGVSLNQYLVEVVANNAGKQTIQNELIKIINSTFIQLSTMAVKFITTDNTFVKNTDPKELSKLITRHTEPTLKYLPAN